MTRAFHGVYQMHQREKVNMRQAAYLVSVARVAEACKLQGLGVKRKERAWTFSKSTSSSRKRRSIRA